MRANRISDILFASFLASAATLAAAPASAQSPYDGLWQVTVVTKSGSCDAQTTSTVNVADGKISGGPVSGSVGSCLLYTSPSPRDRQKSRMPSSA